MALLSPDSSHSTSNASPMPSPRGVLAPILTSPSQPSPRPAVVAAKNRFSTFSVHSNSSLTQPHNSRPQSTAFPQFHSSLAYALVRDFAYPSFHPLHYGPQPDDPSSVTTPSSEVHHRRVSDPAPSFDEPKAKWPSNWLSSDPQLQLPGKAYGEKDGPPWSEDEDLQSPVVTSVRHRKRPEDRRGSYGGTNGDGSETYDNNESLEATNGPGSEDITDPPAQSHPTDKSLSVKETGRRRDSHFAATLPSRSYDEQHADAADDTISSSAPSDDHWDVDDSRYSRDYQFTIVSPDEEMHGKAVALFDFARENENELPLSEGQIILVSYRHGEGWLVAQDPKTGESGLVPEEYVRLLRDIEGGLNGLMNGGLAGLAGELDTTEAKTPTQETSGHHHHHHNQQQQQQQPHHNHSRKESKEYYTPVVSTFSTSREDFKEPYPRDKISSPHASTPTMEFARRESEDARNRRPGDEEDSRPEEANKSENSSVKAPA